LGMADETQVFHGWLLLASTPATNEPRADRQRLSLFFPDGSARDVGVELSPKVLLGLTKRQAHAAALEACGLVRTNEARELVDATRIGAIHPGDRAKAPVLVRAALVHAREREQNLRALLVVEELRLPDHASPLVEIRPDRQQEGALAAERSGRAQR